MGNIFSHNTRALPPSIKGSVSSQGSVVSSPPIKGSVVSSSMNAPISAVVPTVVNGNTLSSSGVSSCYSSNGTGPTGPSCVLQTLNSQGLVPEGGCENATTGGAGYVNVTPGGPPCCVDNPPSACIIATGPASSMFNSKSSFGGNSHMMWIILILLLILFVFYYKKRSSSFGKR
jgi:hypothetical protein